MVLRSLRNLFVSLSLLTCASAFAAPLVVNVAGVESYGEYGDSANTVLTYNVGANVTITGISYNVNVTAFDPSWLSELSLAFEDSTQSNGVFFNPAFLEDDPGTGTYSDAADLVDLGLSFQVGADGILRLEFFEGFDDASVAPDGIWNFGTITFTTDAVDVPPGGGGDVPEPASALLIGAGLAGMGYVSRRRRQGAKVAA